MKREKDDTKFEDTKVEDTVYTVVCTSIEEKNSEKKLAYEPFNGPCCAIASDTVVTISCSTLSILLEK